MVVRVEVAFIVTLIRGGRLCFCAVCLSVIKKNSKHFEPKFTKLCKNIC